MLGVPCKELLDTAQKGATFFERDESGAGYRYMIALAAADCCYHHLCPCYCYHHPPPIVVITTSAPIIVITHVYRRDEAHLCHSPQCLITGFYTHVSRRIATEKKYAAPGARVLADVVGMLTGGPDKPTRPTEPHLLSHYRLFQVWFRLTCRKQAGSVPMKLRMRLGRLMAQLMWRCIAMMRYPCFVHPSLHLNILRALAIHAQDLVENMLVYDPDERIMPQDALAHPFFTKPMGATPPSLSTLLDPSAVEPGTTRAKSASPPPTEPPSISKYEQCFVLELTEQPGTAQLLCRTDWKQAQSPNTLSS